MRCPLMIIRKCPFCGKETRLLVNADQYDKWKAGTLIQNAFPDMNADDREIIMTGICANCFPK